MAKEGTFSLLPWVTLEMFYMRTSKEATVPKIMESFHRIWAMLMVGLMYLAIYATAPFNNQMILSWTTASGRWSLMHWMSWYHCLKDTSVFPGVASPLKVLILRVPILSPAASMLRRLLTSTLARWGLASYCVGSFGPHSLHLWGPLPHHPCWLHCCSQGP